MWFSCAVLLRTGSHANLCDYEHAVHGPVKYVSSTGCVLMFQVTYLVNTTLSHGIISGKPVGRLTLAPGERLNSIFGTSSDFLNSLGFTTDQGLIYGPWGNNTNGIPYRYIGPLTGFFGGNKNQGLVALGVWAIDGSTLAPPPPPPPSPPSLLAPGFDVNVPCPETQLVGSGIDYRLMENQVTYPLPRSLTLVKLSRKVLGAEKQSSCFCT
jgi:hypothetical protein